MRFAFIILLVTLAVWLFTRSLIRARARKKWEAENPVLASARRKMKEMYHPHRQITYARVVYEVHPFGIILLGLVVLDIFIEGFKQLDHSGVVYLCITGAIVLWTFVERNRFLRVAREVDRQMLNEYKYAARRWWNLERELDRNGRSLEEIGMDKSIFDCHANREFFTNLPDRAWDLEF